MKANHRWLQQMAKLGLLLMMQAANDTRYGNQFKRRAAWNG
ncbi:MAG: hypothetical protein V4500_07370 [Pseudomonadota bacterium]